jgi:hypothetical protein
MMSTEDFEKKANFIVEQQAQFASKIGQLEDIVARLAKATPLIDSKRAINAFTKSMRELRLS